MANRNINTYPAVRGGTRRADWSSEITRPDADNVRAAVDTGIGGMARETRDSGARDTREIRGASALAEPVPLGTAVAAGAFNGFFDGNGAHTNGNQNHNGNGNMNGNSNGNGNMNGNSNGNGAHTNGNSNMNGGYMNGNMDEIGSEIENNLPPDIIEDPTTLEEVYRGSMKALLMRNIGNYVVATFLIGTQGTVSWEGILYDVGNDYVAIYQTGRDQYIVSDLYSLKYVEFYDTRRRAMCDELIAASEARN